MTLAVDIAAGVHEYARRVVDGDIITGKKVRAACERHLDDLEHGPSRGIYFNDSEAQHALAFFKFLKQSDGRWKGEPFTLEPWQIFIVGSIFGWVREDGTRRFRTAYVEVARKNGKSALAGALGAYLAFFDQEGRAEVVSAATNERQARIVFDAAGRLVKTLPDRMSAGIDHFRTSIASLDGSSFRPVSKQYNTLDGLNLHCAIIDEFHAHPERGLVDVLRTAMGARTQPLMFYITTAGAGRNSPCYQEHQYAEGVLDGTNPNDYYFAFIAAMDEGDDWEDEANWIKANPNLNVSVSLTNLREEFIEAQQLTSKQNAFRNKRLNEWTEQAVRWMDMGRWDRAARDINLEDLRGRKCYGGIDLSAKIDLSAVVYVFPPRDEDDPYVVVPRLYAPEEQIKVRAKRDRVPYDHWAREGHLRATPGSAVDYAQIRRDIVADNEDLGFRIVEIGFDDWAATEFSQEMDKLGYRMVEVRQGARSMSEPMKLLEALTLEDQIIHDGNPVLRWNMSNISVRIDVNDNIAPDKKASTERIDGGVALVMALSRAIAGADDDRPSVYERRGIITF